MQVLIQSFKGTYNQIIYPPSSERVSTRITHVVCGLTIYITIYTALLYILYTEQYIIK